MCTSTYLYPKSICLLLLLLPCLFSCESLPPPFHKFLIKLSSFVCIGAYALARIPLRLIQYAKTHFILMKICLSCAFHCVQTFHEICEESICTILWTSLHCHVITTDLTFTSLHCHVSTTDLTFTVLHGHVTTTDLTFTVLHCLVTTNHLTLKSVSGWTVSMTFLYLNLYVLLLNTSHSIWRCFGVWWLFWGCCCCFFGGICLLLLFVCCCCFFWGVILDSTCLTIWMLSSQLLNHLQPNCVWWSIIMGQCHAKWRVCYHRWLKVTVRGSLLKHTHTHTHCSIS